MGCNFLFSGKNDYDKDEDTSPNPNKYNFTIKEVIDTSVDYTLLIVNYPNCTTFNGDKLMIVKGPINNTQLDPHIFKDGNIIARFKPDNEGKAIGLFIMKELKSESFRNV